AYARRAQAMPRPDLKVTIRRVRLTHSVPARWQWVTRAKEFIHYHTTACQDPAEKTLAPAQLVAHSLVEPYPSGGRVRPVHLLLVGAGGLPDPVHGHGVRRDHGLPPAAHPPEFSDPPARGIPPGRPGLSLQPGRALAVGGGPPRSSSTQRRRRRPP